MKWGEERGRTEKREDEKDETKRRFSRKRWRRMYGLGHRRCSLPRLKAITISGRARGPDMSEGGWKGRAGIGGARRKESKVRETIRLLSSQIDPSLSLRNSNTSHSNSCQTRTTSNPPAYTSHPFLFHSTDIFLLLHTLPLLRPLIVTKSLDGNFP